MIRLNLPKEPYWLDLPFDVRLLVRPLDTAVNAAAHADAANDLRQRGNDTPPAATDKFWQTGLLQEAIAKSMGQYAIIAWRGVLAADDTEAPVTAENVAMLMAIPKMAIAFMNLIYAPLDQLAAEGNASGTAQSGILAAVPNTADDAGPEGNPVQTVPTF